MARNLVARPVEVRVEDVDLTQLLDETFVTEFRRAFPEAKFAQLRIAIPRDLSETGEPATAKVTKAKKRKRYEPVGIGHYAPDHDERHLLTLQCEDPETLEAVERIIANLPARTEGT